MDVDTDQPAATAATTTAMAVVTADPAAAAAAAAAAAEAAKAEKRSRRLERRRLSRAHVDRVLGLIQAAQTPQDLLAVVVLLEESIADAKVRSYHKHALPYEAPTVAAVALRVYAVDRAIRYGDFKVHGLEARQSADVTALPFRPRWQTQPRCLASAGCCGPLWHAGRCHSLAHFAPSSYSSVSALAAAPIANVSRHPEIMDPQGGFFLPPQGVEVPLEEINKRAAEFNEELKKKQAAANKKQRQSGGGGSLPSAPSASSLAAAAAAAATATAGAAAAAAAKRARLDDDMRYDGEYEEHPDEVDDELAARRKANKRDFFVHNIDLEAGYHPVSKEIADIRTGL